jgi:succinoglycan biosynthesis transport protein ExoP
LSNRRLETLLREVKDQYDLIFVDSPPSEVLIDARIIGALQDADGPLIDGVLYCAKWGETESNSVSRGIKALQGANAHILGVVLGQVRRGEYKLYETRKVHTHGPYLEES